MKTLIKILCLSMLWFSCESSTEPETEDIQETVISLDWILLKKGDNNPFWDGDYTVENCDEINYNIDIENNFYCNDWDWLDPDENCGEYILSEPAYFDIESCDGYELCREVSDYGSTPSKYDCCMEIEEPIYEEDEFTGDYQTTYRYQGYYANEYILIWNEDLNLCDRESCAQNDVYDIIIPEYIPEYSDDCYSESDCQRARYFHPNCDTPKDTTMIIGTQSISFDNLGWLSRGLGNYGEPEGYIHYYPFDNFLFIERDTYTFGNEIDLKSYKIVAYERK